MNKLYEVKLTTKFKKQLKIIRKHPNFDYNALDKIINMLSNNEMLPAKYRNHLLEPKSKRNMGMSCSARFIARIQEK